ncbi:hypothetical protein DFJ73DRAFT_564369 [Zopfochytrium polystomum]|nr:hypothetical protein DFJ73DRAFT_564369 [Zopfochytrium polystomum]
MLLLARDGGGGGGGGPTNRLPTCTRGRGSAVTGEVATAAAAWNQSMSRKGVQQLIAHSEQFARKVLVLGANGQIARFAIDLFLERTDCELTLYARDTSRLKNRTTEKRVRVVEGDVLDLKGLEKVVPGHDVVYANLDGDLPRHARNIVSAMNTAGLKRLIFISSMGIYDEVPGQRYKSILDPYRDAALFIESTDLDYTIIRPEWLNNKDEIDYEITHKGELFKNPNAYLSRKSVADLVVKLATNPGCEVRQSLGVNKP